MRERKKIMRIKKIKRKKPNKKNKVNFVSLHGSSLPRSLAGSTFWKTLGWSANWHNAFRQFARAYIYIYIIYMIIIITRSSSSRSRGGVSFGFFLLLFLVLPSVFSLVLHAFVIFPMSFLFSLSLTLCSLSARIPYCNKRAQSSIVPPFSSLLRFFRLARGTSPNVYYFIRTEITAVLKPQTLQQR